jgi:sorbitol-specific phosphotransferase system component IIC
MKNGEEKGKRVRFLKVILSGILCPFFISLLRIINPLLSLTATKNIAKIVSNSASNQFTSSSEREICFFC